MITAKGFWQASSKLGRGREREKEGGDVTAFVAKLHEELFAGCFSCNTSRKKTAKTFGNQKLFLTAKPKGHSHLVVLIASHILEGMQVFCSVHIKY